MQTSREKDKVTDEILSSSEYKIIQTTIDEISKLLILLENDMREEFAQIQTLNKILDSQLNILENIKDDSVVSLDYIRRLKKEYSLFLLVVSEKAHSIKITNSYINERIQQMNVLHIKRKELIKRLSPADIIEFKGKNEKNKTDK